MGLRYSANLDANSKETLAILAQSLAPKFKLFLAYITYPGSLQGVNAEREQVHLFIKLRCFGGSKRLGDGVQ